MPKIFLNTQKREKIGSPIILTVCLLKVVRMTFLLYKSVSYTFWKQNKTGNKNKDCEHAFHSRNPKVTHNSKGKQEYWQQHDGYKADNLDLTNNPTLSLLLKLW